MDIIPSRIQHIITIKYFTLLIGIAAIFTTVYSLHTPSFIPPSLSPSPPSNPIDLRNLNKVNHLSLLTHLFIKNITQYPYIGNWSNLAYSNNTFDHTEGDSLIYLSPNTTQIPPSYPMIYTNDSLITNYSSLILIFYLRDGEYTDTLFKGNLTLTFPSIFNDTLLSSMNDMKPFSIINKNTTVTVYQGEYFDETVNDTYDSSEVELTFHPKEKVFVTNTEYASSNLYSKIQLHINNTDRKFSIDIISIMTNTDGYSIRLLNYSIVFSLIGLIQIYYSTKAIIEINANIQFGLNVDLITVGLQIIWGSIISAVHFFLSLTHNEQIYEYGTPSFINFLLFAVFQLKILFMAWKSRYNDLFTQNIFLFRKQLFRFYLMFYIGLFMSLTTLKYWYHSFPILYIQYVLTWIFQIIHSAYHNTKPPFSYCYIYVFTLSKLFTAIYIKAYSDNIFGYRPTYLKVALITITLLLEAIVLSIQKLIGPKFFIPKSLRSQAYNYYRDISEITDAENECVICLEKLEGVALGVKEKDNDVRISMIRNEESEEVVDMSMKKIKASYYERLMDYIEKNNKVKKKEFMVTSCGHTFHTVCLEKWLEMKNECPYCRHKIPPLEY